MYLNKNLFIFDNSIHIDGEFNGKMETKDVSTEMDVFETEMEIKSSCINGKVI